MPALVTQSDARPTADQATFFSGDDLEIFSVVILSLRLIQEGQLSVSDIECTLILEALLMSTHMFMWNRENVMWIPPLFCSYAVDMSKKIADEGQTV